MELAIAYFQLRLQNSWVIPLTSLSGAYIFVFLASFTDITRIECGTKYEVVVLSSYLTRWTWTSFDQTFVPPGQTRRLPDYHNIWGPQEGIGLSGPNILVDTRSTVSYIQKVPVLDSSQAVLVFTSIGASYSRLGSQGVHCLAFVATRQDRRPIKNGTATFDREREPHKQGPHVTDLW